MRERRGCDLGSWQFHGGQPKRHHRQRRSDRQFNLLSAAVKAPYVGEKSTQSGRILGKAIVDKVGGAGANGKVIIGNCFPGLTVLENRAKGVENRSRPHRVSRSWAHLT